MRVPPLCNPTYRDPWNSCQHLKASWWNLGPLHHKPWRKTRVSPSPSAMKCSQENNQNLGRKQNVPSHVGQKEWARWSWGRCNCLTPHWKKPADWQTQEMSATHGREVYSWGSHLNREARCSSWCRTGTGMIYYTLPTVRQSQDISARREPWTLSGGPWTGPDYMWKFVSYMCPVLFVRRQNQLPPSKPPCTHSQLLVSLSVG